MNRAAITIERNGLEITVEVEGVAHRAHRGRKDHPMDRFAEPDEEAYAEVTECHVAEYVFNPSGEDLHVGESIDLTDAETKQAQEAIMEAASDQADNDRESAAEARRERDYEL